MNSITLNTGAKMPQLGLGTWKSPKDSAGQAVKCALTEGGYTHIDCAAVYQNEKEIGETFGSVFNGAIKREEVFITSKLWNSAHRKDRVRLACEETLRDLQLDYLDLYLMHWGIATPYPENAEVAAKNNWDKDESGRQILDKVSVRETWEAMQELVTAGLVRAIGVSNFTPPMLIDLLTYAEIKPAMLQIESHPYLQQSRFLEFCAINGINVTAYSPLGSPGNYAESGKPVLIKEPVILKLAETHRKTAAQILIRFAIQRGTVVIPKSVHPERIKENIQVFDFELSESDMNAIMSLERRQRYVDPYTWGQVPYFD